MEVAVIGDSHIPSRATAIPPSFEERIRGADHVVHTGDFTTDSAIDHVRDLADSLTAVHGNMDGRGVDLSGVATLAVEGVTFVVTHGTGSTAGYEKRVADLVREEAGEEAIGIAGHTHEVLDTVVDGVRLLNPGSVTGAAPATRTTMMTVDVDAGAVEVSIHEIDQ